jgi:cytochrome P450
MNALTTSQPADRAPDVGGLPLLGPSLALFQDPYRWWAEQARRHGPVYRLTLPIQGRHWIALAGQEANALLARRGQELFSQERTYPRARQILCTGTHPSITEGPVQQHLHRLIAGGFTTDALRPHVARLDAHLREAVSGWKVGEAFNVTERTARLGLDAISLYASGAPLGLPSEDVRRYATAFTGVIAMNWPMLTMHIPSVMRTRLALDTMIRERLDAHRAAPPGAARAPDYFDLLLSARMPDGAPLPERVAVVFGQIPFKNMGVYAGRVLNHFLYMVAHHPEVRDRVLPELDAVFQRDRVDLDALSTLRWTRAALHETLRMLPIAVAVQRTVTRPFEFSGYRFEPGQRLFFPISATHFDPQHFPEPERFLPERFLGDRRPAPFTWNPFGVGHHACVARSVFEAIALLTVGRVLHRWTLDASYELRSLVDALPGPWSGHTMRVVADRQAAPMPIAAPIAA